MAILDIGATQDIVGEAAMLAIEDELSRCGLRAIEVPTTASTPTGVGGAAKVLRTMLVPISPGGVPAVVQFVVIEGGVPPLLSVGLLEHLGASMDLVTNRIHFKAIDVEMKMTNLPTGHRAIQLVQWPGGSFPVPAAAKEQYRLKDEAFAKQSAASSAYTKEGCSQRALNVPSALVLDTDQDVIACSERSVLAPHELPVAASHVLARKHAPVHAAAVPAPEHVPVHAAVGDLEVRTDLHDVLPLAPGSTALMGNVTFASPQFENLSRHPEHGTPVSFDGGCGNQQRATSGATMAGDGAPNVLHPGVHSRELLLPGSGRAHAEKPRVGAKEVPHGSPPGAGQVSTPGSSCAKGEPIRHVDSVLEVFGTSELSVTSRPGSQEQSQGLGGKLRSWLPRFRP